MAVGKSLRFEVFARDIFTCQYCGRRTPDVILEVDHIHPVSRGGDDDPINLITSCFDCNRGKRAKIISDVAPRPDADLALLKIQQELVEVKRFLAAKKMRDKAVKELCDSVRDTWADKLTEVVPTDRILIPWIVRYGPEEIEKSIICAIPAYISKRFGFDPDRACTKLIPFIGGILRNRRDKELGTVQ